MGLIGDPRDPHVNAQADADRIGILNLLSGQLQVVPELNRGWISEATIAGNWLLRRESHSASGCVGECMQWRLYEQPADLSTPPVLLQASPASGPITDEPNPISDGRVVVWQQMDSNARVETMVTALGSNPRPRTIARGYGSAVQLALDSAGNVLIDRPLAANRASTTLVRVNIETGRTTNVGLDDAHYPALLGDLLTTISGGLAMVQASSYSPEGLVTRTTIVNTSQTEYDAQPLSSRYVLVYNVQGLAVVDMASGEDRVLPVTIDTRASVAADHGRVVFAISHGASEVVLAADAPAD